MVDELKLASINARCGKKETDELIKRSFYSAAQQNLHDAIISFVKIDPSYALFNAIRCRTNYLHYDMAEDNVCDIKINFFKELLSLEGVNFVSENCTLPLTRLQLYCIILNQCESTAILTINDQLYFLNKNSTIIIKTSDYAYTVFMTTGDVFTIVIDSNSREYLQDVESILNRYTNGLNSSRADGQTLYRRENGIRLELFRKEVQSNANFELYLDNKNTAVLQVGDRSFALTNQTVITKPTSKSFYIKDYSALIEFPTFTPMKEITALEHFICELRFRNSLDEMPSFCILLTVLENMEDLFDVHFDEEERLNNSKPDIILPQWNESCEKPELSRAFSLPNNYNNDGNSLTSSKVVASCGSQSLPVAFPVPNNKNDGNSLTSSKVVATCGLPVAFPMPNNAIVPTSGWRNMLRGLRGKIQSVINCDFQEKETLMKIIKDPNLHSLVDRLLRLKFSDSTIQILKLIILPLGLFMLQLLYT